jgi:hypothetical protein
MVSKQLDNCRREHGKQGIAIRLPYRSSHDSGICNGNQVYVRKYGISMVGAIHNLWHWLFSVHSPHLVFSGRGNVHDQEWRIFLALRSLAIDAGIYEIGGEI